MTQIRRARGAPVASAGRLISVLALSHVCASTALADPPASVVDSQSIVRSLAAPSAPPTRGLIVAPHATAGGGNSAGAGGNSAGGGEHKITLDIRFGNDSDRLTPAAHAQLEQLGTAFNSPELAHARFLIAGHTSASGAAEHNRRLSEARARAVRSYMIEHFHIAPGRLESTGFGSARPLPDYPPNALQQRRVEISTLPPAS